MKKFDEEVTKSVLGISTVMGFPKGDTQVAIVAPDEDTLIQFLKENFPKWGYSPAKFQRIRIVSSGKGEA